MSKIAEWYELFGEVPIFEIFSIDIRFKLRCVNHYLNQKIGFHNITKLIRIKSTKFDYEHEIKHGYEFVLSDGKTIKCGVDIAGGCCEVVDWNLYKDNENIDDFKKFNGIDLEVKNESFISVEMSDVYDKNNGCGDCDNRVDVIVKTINHTYKVTFSNEHNGWYSHDVVLIKSNGEVNQLSI